MKITIKLDERQIKEIDEIVSDEVREHAEDWHCDPNEPSNELINATRHDFVVDAVDEYIKQLNKTE